jgi:hypothetical protein
MWESNPDCPRVTSDCAQHRDHSIRYAARRSLTRPFHLDGSPLALPTGRLVERDRRSLVAATQATHSRSRGRDVRTTTMSAKMTIAHCNTHAGMGPVLQVGWIVRIDVVSGLHERHLLRRVRGGHGQSPPMCLARGTRTATPPCTWRRARPATPDAGANRGMVAEIRIEYDDGRRAVCEWGVHGRNDRARKRMEVLGERSPEARCAI